MLHIDTVTDNWTYYYKCIERLDRETTVYKNPNGKGYLADIGPLTVTIKDVFSILEDPNKMAIVPKGYNDNRAYIVYCPPETNILCKYKFD